MRFLILLMIAGVSVPYLVSAKEDSHDSFSPHHTLGFMISHTQVSQGVQTNGNKKWLSLPSWALNYNYKFSPKWAIGLHNDIIVEDFVVQEHLKNSGGETLERSYPVASAVMASYKPGKYFRCRRRVCPYGQSFLDKDRCGVQLSHLKKI